MFSRSRDDAAQPSRDYGRYSRFLCELFSAVSVRSACEVREMFQATVSLLIGCGSIYTYS